MDDPNELRFNGKTYRRINGKWSQVEPIDIVSHNGKNYKKVSDGLGDPKEACIQHCVFCEHDEDGNPECGAPKCCWGCNAGFHWEEV